jgi:hypothetical protein
MCSRHRREQHEQLIDENQSRLPSASSARWILASASWDGEVQADCQPEPGVQNLHWPGYHDTTLPWLSSAIF